MADCCCCWSWDCGCCGSNWLNRAENLVEELLEASKSIADVAVFAVGTPVPFEWAAAAAEKLVDGCAAAAGKRCCCSMFTFTLGFGATGGGILSPPIRFFPTFSAVVVVVGPVGRFLLFAGSLEKAVTPSRSFFNETLLLHGCCCCCCCFVPSFFDDPNKMFWYWLLLLLLLLFPPFCCCACCGGCCGTIGPLFSAGSEGGIGGEFPNRRGTPMAAAAGEKIGG